MFGPAGADRNWDRGAAGEERVARQLANLPRPPWIVLHDLPVGAKGANIDHLVVGPAGVYTLNTKNLSGRIWVGGGTFLQNGSYRPYVPDARREAKRAASRLARAAGCSVSVTGLVVVLADNVVVKTQPGDVRVLTRRQLTRWLVAQPSMLQPDLILRIAAAAGDRSTWA